MRKLLFVACCLAGALTATGARAQDLDVTFTSHSAGGRYAPAHVMAVWVTSADGTFERTLHVWGSTRRRRHLGQWVAARPTADALDGISSATLRTHGAQDVHWDLRDYNGNEVPDGDYVVRIEMADSNTQSANPQGSFAFTKSPEGYDGADGDAHYTDVHLVYTPGAVVEPDTDAGVREQPDAGVFVDDPGDDEQGGGCTVSRGVGHRHASTLALTTLLLGAYAFSRRRDRSRRRRHEPGRAYVADRSGNVIAGASKQHG